MLLTRPLLFFAGKGGVGKTTLATAAAARLAAQGARTLLVSTDPAHSTADLLDVPLGGAPAPVAERLEAVEVDAAAEAEAYVARIAADAEAALPADVMPAVRRQLALAAAGPGTQESALFDRVVDLVGRFPDDYDRVVVDTAPTGHTLRLLSLPEALGSWLDGLVARREDAGRVERYARALASTREDPPDPVLDRLRARRRRLADAARRLRDDAAVVLVCIPEGLPVAESRRARAALEEAGLTVGAVVANRVLPADAGADREGGFLRDLVAQQAPHLEAIAAAFGDLPLLHVPQRRREVGAADLAAVGDVLAPLLGPAPPTLGRTPASDDAARR